MHAHDREYKNVFGAIKFHTHSLAATTDAAASARNGRGEYMNLSAAPSRPRKLFISCAAPSSSIYISEVYAHYHAALQL